VLRRTISFTSAHDLPPTIKAKADAPRRRVAQRHLIESLREVVASAVDTITKYSCAPDKPHLTPLYDFKAFSVITQH
jgi:hypothetical protein